jgi:hypothetical protein
VPFFVIAEGMPLPTVQELGLRSLVDTLGSRANYLQDQTTDSVFSGPHELRAEANAIVWAAEAAPWFRDPGIYVLKALMLRLACRKLALLKALTEPDPLQRKFALHRDRAWSSYHKWKILPGRVQRLAPVQPPRTAGVPEWAFADLRNVSDEYLKALREYVRSHDMDDPAHVRVVQDRRIAPLSGQIGDLAAEEAEMLEALFGAKCTVEERQITETHRADLQHARRNLDAIRLLCERSPIGSEAEQWPWSDDYQSQLSPPI